MANPAEELKQAAIAAILECGDIVDMHSDQCKEYRRAMRGCKCCPSELGCTKLNKIMRIGLLPDNEAQVALGQILPAQTVAAVAAVDTGEEK